MNQDLNRKPASFASCFGLLRKRFVALMSLAIFLIVGSEVAMNSNIANIINRFPGNYLIKV